MTYEIPPTAQITAHGSVVLSVTERELPTPRDSLRG
jgi:hypothetical protein